MITINDSILPVSLPCNELGTARRAAMFDLLSRHFDGVTFSLFESDLARKNHVVLLEAGGRLVGFSTLLVYETQFDGEPVSVVYSGDTIVAPEAWRSPTLSRAWIATVNKLRRDFPRGRYYWLLITSGYRTYRFLPVFWREFFPHHAIPTPHRTKALLDHLAHERFGGEYDRQSGIVRFRNPQRLRPALASMPEGRLADPHIAFFASRNPGHGKGDELVCLTELTESNLTPAGWRMVNFPGR